MNTVGNGLEVPDGQGSGRFDVNVALLRGINVGGNNRLPMKDLVAMFVDAGCEEVQSYIQSGNALFRSDPTLREDIPSRISAAIFDRFGYRVPIIARTAQEFGEVVRANPFTSANPDAGNLHVVFLADQPDPALAESLDPNRSLGDEFAVLGREIYLNCPDGFARTKLTNSYFDSRLSATSTTRNWRTVLKLLELIEARG